MNISSDIVKNESKREYFFQIDALKAMMIFLVIFDHAIPGVYKINMGIAFWERISIPVFLVILGFNMGLSFKQKEGSSLKELYSYKYFKRKFWRYIYPYLVLYLISTIIGLIIYNFDILAMLNGQLYDDTLYILPYAYWRFGYINLFMGILPFWGPGNWFLPLLFQSILIMPLLYKGLSSKLPWRILTLILCFLVEILSYYLILHLYFNPPFTSYEQLFNFLFVMSSVIIYISAIGLGMWFSKDYSLKSKQNLFMWILFPISFIYIILNQFFGIYVDFIYGDYNFLVFPYSAFLFLIGMNVLPKKVENKFSEIVSIIGKATYHILLVQILYFGITTALYGTHYCSSIFGINLGDPLFCALHLIINWLICIPFGVLWWYLENKIRNYRIKEKLISNFVFFF